MFLVGGVNATTDLLPAALVAPLMGAMSLLGVYFHVNPSQTYNEPTPNV
jgi:hypothetical protein